MTRTRAALAAAALYHACFAALALSGALLSRTEAQARGLTTSFTPVGTIGAWRLDGVRDGVHEGATVRFVDMTLHNRSAETTFPESIQAIWWQGRNWGEKVEARFRDLKRFGMYDTIKPGEQIAVTYIMPVRPDIDGIRADYMMAPAGQQERRWTWAELMGGGPGTFYHKGRPVGTASAPAATARAGAAPRPEPAPKRDADARGQSGQLLNTLGGLKGLLGPKGRRPF